MTGEYVRRLLKGELKLKDKTLQLKACQKVVEDAENLHRLFTTMVRRSSEPTVFSLTAKEKAFKSDESE